MARNVIIGTSGDDVLRGTNGRDIIKGRGGDDIIKGKGGGDILIGGSGDDIIYGQKGRDVIKGNSGDDDLYGNKAKDILVGGTDADDLWGGSGPDIFRFRDGDGFHSDFPALTLGSTGFDDVVWDYQDGSDKFDVPVPTSPPLAGLGFGPDGSGVIYGEVALITGSFFVDGFPIGSLGVDDFI